MLGEEIESTKAKQTELGESAKQYAEQNKKIEENAQKWGTVADMVNSAGSAFSSLGSAFEIPAFNVASIIASAIASVIQGYSTATAQAGTLGPWAWAAFALSGLSQVAAVISQIHSLSGYAQGGIVGGGKYVGDAQTVRVNSGEMILTSEQQTRLFRVLNGSLSTPSNNNVAVIGDVKIKGSDLYLSLRNYSKIQKSAGKNISI